MARRGAHLPLSLLHVHTYTPTHIHANTHLFLQIAVILTVVLKVRPTSRFTPTHLVQLGEREQATHVVHSMYGMYVGAYTVDSVAWLSGSLVWVISCDVTATMCTYCPAPFRLFHRASNNVQLWDHIWAMPTEGEGMMAAEIRDEGAPVSLPMHCYPAHAHPTMFYIHLVYTCT